MLEIPEGATMRSPLPGAALAAKVARALNDRDRLTALHGLQLLDTPPEPAFDRITRLASTSTGCTAALLSLIDAERQFNKSAVGLWEPWAANQNIPISHSYSKFVVATGKPIVIEDAREHPLTRHDPALEELGALAYLGHPIFTRDGYAIGSLCIFDRQPREWTRPDIQALEDAAALAMTEIGQRQYIAQLEQVEAALRLSESRLEAAQRIAHLGHWDWDIRTDDLYWSREIFRIFGLEPESFAPSYPAFLDRIHPDDRERVVAAVADAVACGTPYSIDHRIVRPDGSVRYIHEEGELSRDAAGTPVRMLGTAQDITDRYLAELRLAERENRLGSILDAEPAFVGVLSPDGMLQDINPAGLQLLEASAPSMVIGTLVDTFVAPEYQSDFAALRERVLHGASDRLELELVGLEGTRRWAEIRAAPLRDANEEIIAILALASDTTDRRRLEEQLRQSQKMDAVGRLASGVAHDFNNVLTAVIGSAILALENLEDTSPVRADLEEILRSAEHGAGLIQQLLLFGRPHEPSIKDVDLNELITKLESMLRRLIGKEIALATSLAPALGPIRADRARLEQLVLNLVVNARDAMPARGRVGIETRAVELSEEHVRRSLVPKAGTYVRLTVADTGCGIDRGAISKIFEPFFTTKAEGEGTGLGLATVYGVVKQCGGGIQVESELGHGTTFEIYLPMNHEQHRVRSRRATRRAVPLVADH